MTGPTIDEVEAAATRNGQLFPVYRDHGIVNLIDSVPGIFGGTPDRPLAPGHLPSWMDDTVDHVVMVIVDGLGWERMCDLRRRYEAIEVIAGGQTTPLVSTYPSETAAAMISLYTGLQPIEHGNLGWFVKLANHDEIGLSLPFTTLSGDPLDEAYGYSTDETFDVPTDRSFVSRLRNLGVDVCFVMPESFVNTTTTRQATGSATRVPYQELDHGIDHICADIATANGPTVHQLYVPDADEAAHRYGAASETFAETVNTVCRSLIDGFGSSQHDVPTERTALIVTADHGILDTAPETRIDLNHLEASGSVNLSAHLARNSAGEPMYLAGSPRNLQCYTRPGHARTLADELTDAIDGIAFTSEAYREAGLFGDREAGAMFRYRAPDVVFVPESAGVWYDDGTLDVIGMHGGLHPSEMFVPLCTRRVAALP